MKLDEHYTVTGEANNWILKYEKETGEIREDGKPVVSKDQWYYPKLGMALKKYMEESLKPSKSISDVLIRLSEVEDTIERITVSKSK